MLFLCCAQMIHPCRSDSKLAQLLLNEGQGQMLFTWQPQTPIWRQSLLQGTNDISVSSFKRRASIALGLSSASQHWGFSSFAFLKEALLKVVQGYILNPIGLDSLFLHPLLRINLKTDLPIWLPPEPNMTAWPINLIPWDGSATRVATKTVGFY